MTREQAKEIFLNRGYIEVDCGVVYDGDKWREACVVISEWLKEEPILDKIKGDVINIADGKQSIKVRSVLRIIDKYKAAESEEK